MNGFIRAEFSSYRQAEEAASKLLAIRAEQIGIELADPPGTFVVGVGPFGEALAGGAAHPFDAEFAGDELPPYGGRYRLTAHVNPEARQLADRIISSCGGRAE